MTSTSAPRIAIIGAGLGGLSLLAHLQRHSIPATIYERDSAFDSRSHLGGILDLHYESGQRALNEAGIAWKHLTLPEGEETRIYDAKGTLLYEDDGHHGPPGPPEAEDEHSRPEIDRTVLRKLLYDYVAPSSINWSHKLTSTRQLPDGTHELTFAHGATTTCDLLVGADGAWSKVRPLVSPATPDFTGITGAEISLAPATIASTPALQDVVSHLGQGTSFALQSGKALISQRNGDGRIRSYAWFHADESFALPPDPAEARAALLAHYEGWAPWLQTLITDCDPAAIYLRPMYTLPVGHAWPHVRGVTLLGDAGHLMSPFAGEGANQALLDGLELANGLAAAVQGGAGAWEEALVVFESEMCKRAAELAAEAERNSRLFLGPAAPKAVVEFFEVGMSALSSKGVTEPVGDC